MSEKTKNKSWLPWAVLIAAVTGIGLIFVHFEWDIYLSPPWALAERITAVISVESFKTGVFEEQVFWGWVFQALAGLLILFVIGPSLWIYSEIRNQSRDEQQQLKKGPLWYAGTAIVIFGLFTGVVGTVVEGMTFQNVWESAEISANEDELRSKLMKLGFDAYQVYYLPAKMGGGGGSFQVTTDEGVKRRIQLKDLKHYSDTLSNSYVLERADSANTITIYGIGTTENKDEKFNNANGDQGMIQLAVKVLPGDQIIQME